MSRQLNLGKQQWWLRHVQGWQRSSLSVRDYCACHRLSEPSFYAWRRVLDERGLLTPAGVAAARADTEESAVTPLFVAAKVADVEVASQALEVMLPDGLAVRVAAGFDAATLRRLLAVLRGQSC